MYIPERFQVENREEIINLINASPFATLISVVNNDTFVSHLPLILEQSGEDLKLIGHLARANPHHQLMKDSSVKVIFHGPSAYITLHWYTENSVPTWNYAVVHIQGVVSLIEDEKGILKCLAKLTSYIEKDRKDPWTFWIPEDLAGAEQLCAAVVGFEIRITDISAKFKLSQNRSDEDRRSVIKNLKLQSDQQSHAVAEYMKRSFA